jgi:hypothetical protein
MELPALRHATEGILLIAATVVIHTTGTLLLLRQLFNHRDRAERPFGYVYNTFILTGVVVYLLLLHLLEIGVWAWFYQRHGCFADMDTSVYFSLVTYATVGYGDVVLNPEWRLLGGAEALAGVLMMSWSTAILIALLNRTGALLRQRWGQKPPQP